jgi:fermentation-respiration switch protein FrsA (DUF1100 family)
VRRRLRRGAARLLGLGLILYATAAVVLSSLQARIIFPGSATQGDPSVAVRPLPGEELVRLRTRAGDPIVALFGPALRPDGTPEPDAPRRPTVLYFYGNGMCLRYAEDEFGRLRRLGFNVLIPEYAGYGLSGGRAGEAGCLATADAAYDHLVQRRDVDPDRIVAAGWSLGGAVAVDLASRRRVAGLVALCTFTSMTDMARRTFPFLPVRVLLRHRFDNAAKIARVTCPILLGHGRRDALIPFAMRDRLAARAKGPVTRLTVDGAGHNDFYDTGGAQVFDAIREFVAGLPPSA